MGTLELQIIADLAASESDLAVNVEAWLDGGWSVNELETALRDVLAVIEKAKAAL